ncbi:ABC transporter substrate-binding protein [Gracilibacillus alcaliphilus]|uniref:ABC transporter substrate-binding protein n=1 Tax=Gracilibacillus alcaliphilus TaxID=1401441 RepID=UPI001957FAE0|nr:sugar ABC transporter substrate-binding protein [Gracilibacillus alcaliphilus]MBM7675678.1 ABC-type glycerol-3-phosphate transport system substrate-binding protein [Gracilibacillus alcaliphilus]
MKKILVVISIVLMSVLFIACNNDSATDGGSEDGVVELSFWRHEHPEEEAALRNLIESFEEEHPNIKVNMEIQTDYETAIRTALSGGTAPDIMQIDGPTLASYAENGAILPLDEYYERDGGKDDLLDSVVESLTYEDQMYAAPLNDASVAMFYNKKLFEENGVELPPTEAEEAWTWEEVLEAAKQITDAENGIYGWQPSMGGVQPGEAQVFSLLPYLWQAGGDIVDEDITTASGYLDSDESIRALDFIRSLYHEEGVAPIEQQEDPFPNGVLGISVVGPWEIAYLENEFPDFVFGEDWDIAPLWRDSEQVTPNGSWNMAITSQSDFPDEAWLFIDWVTGEEGAKVWYEKTRNLPARESTMEAFEDLNSHPMKIFVDQAREYAKPRPVTPDYIVISQTFGDLFESVVINNSDVGTAVEGAVEDINNVLAE